MLSASPQLAPLVMIKCSPIDSNGLQPPSSGKILHPEIPAIDDRFSLSPTYS
jgi:hypothetical protein